MLVKKMKRREDQKRTKMTWIKPKVQKRVQRASEQAVKMKVSTPVNKNDAYNLDTSIYCVDLVVISYVTCSLVALGK